MLQNRNILKSRLFILVLKAIKLFSVRFEIYILNFRADASKCVRLQKF